LGEDYTNPENFCPASASQKVIKGCYEERLETRFEFITDHPLGLD